LRYDGQILRDLSVVLYQQRGGGSMTVPAEKVVLFPASPSGRFRIVEACLSTTENGMCFQTFVFDRQAALEEIWAGQYGPIRWLRWNPDEQFVALVSHDEDASSIHIVEAATGRSFEYPAKAFHEKWQVRQETFAWAGPRRFTIKIAQCADCAVEQKELGF
jgi:hypothetical protein